MTVAVAYLHPEYMHYRFIDSRDALLQTSTDTVRVSKLSGPGISRNRNVIAAWFLAQESIDWLLWVDADMVFMPEHLEELLAFDRPLVGAHTVRVNEDYTTTCSAVSQAEDGTFGAVEVNQTVDLMPVDGLGMAFTLIHKDVYRDVGVAMGHPHRERFVQLGENKPVLVGEDVGFCLYAAEKGYGPLLAPKVRIGHVKSRVYT